MQNPPPQLPDPAGQRPQLAARADQTTRANPWPLALLAAKLKAYIERTSPTWVEGQVIEYTPRAGTRMAFFKLRDLQANASMTVKAYKNIVDAAGPGFIEGARVVVRAQPDFYEGSGDLSLMAHEVHTTGIGDLLARIEILGKQLHAEGLFDAARKRPLPFLPRRIGLICGSNAKAKHDVIVNAQARWPGAQFVVREVAVQGPNCVAEVGRAAQELEGMADVDVIIITRGGGAVEDLLPFSDERLVRYVAAMKTPVVSAIGHETDTPLLDYVADYRASTPTDAARRVVPDLAVEQQFVATATTRLQGALSGVIRHHQTSLAEVASRPVLKRPETIFTQQADALAAMSHRLATATTNLLATHSAWLEGRSTQLRALSPTSVLARGYSILRLPGGQVVTGADQVKKGDLLEGFLASGSLVAQVIGSSAKAPINTMKGQD